MNQMAQPEWDPPSSIVTASQLSPLNMTGLPQVHATSEKTRHFLRRFQHNPEISSLISELTSETGLSLATDGPAISDRPSGIKRVGITVVWIVPSLSTRFAIGLETPLVHRVIDQITGFSRSEAQHHLPTTPVEWGFWTVIAARLTDLINRSSVIPRVVLDRVGADPFDFSGIGTCRTITWELLHHDQPVGLTRCWVPDTLLNAAQWPMVGCQTKANPEFGSVLNDIVVQGRAQAGFLELPEGLSRLRPKLILPWTDAPITGKLPAIDGPVICRMAEGESRWTFAARLLPESHGSQIELLNLPRFNPTPVSKGLHMSAEKSSDSSDLPVTLTIELGRLNLSVAKLADLKPGDVLNLNRSVSEPVEITSGERLVARGELVQIEEQIGVRILQVLL